MQLSEISGRGLVLLGCGKMGSALLEGWLAGGLDPAAVTVLEPSPAPALEALAQRGLTLNGTLPERPAVAVLAVKPQAMGAALPRLAELGNGPRSSSPSPPAPRSAPSNRRSATVPRSSGRCRTPRPRSAAASPRWSATPMSTQAASRSPRR